jgi:hypothetical protein
MDREKRNLIAKIARQVLSNPVKWADLLISALEWHLDKAFTLEELKETFGEGGDL